MSRVTLGGLRIVSDIPLFGLPACRESGEAHDIAIRRRPIPETLATDAAVLSGGTCTGPYNGRDLIIELPAGRFLLHEGKEIFVEPAPSVDDDELRIYLLGTIFGVLSHQRGIVPLHAATIDVPGGCVAFVGASRSGKSTLAAALAARGHQVIADDVCFQKIESGSAVRVWPGIARIRLWEDAMQALGCDGPGVVREMHGFNKYFIPIRMPEYPVRSRQLLGVYELQPCTEEPSITRLQGAAAIEVLMQNVYRLRIAELLGYKPAAFALCVAAARGIPVFRFSRAFDFGTFAAGIDLLERHLGGIAQPPSRHVVERRSR